MGSFRLRGVGMDGNVDRDIIILAKFIEVYCEAKHPNEEKVPWSPENALAEFGLVAHPILCKDCIDLMDYSSSRRRLCPLDPKPTCRNCKIHCYAGSYRDRIRSVMRFSGRHCLRYALTRGMFRELFEILKHFL